jgi:hypothetical protein
VEVFGPGSGSASSVVRRSIVGDHLRTAVILVRELGAILHRGLRVGALGGERREVAFVAGR